LIHYIHCYILLPLHKLVAVATYIAITIITAIVHTTYYYCWFTTTYWLVIITLHTYY
jgi:hypothetical protein